VAAPLGRAWRLACELRRCARRPGGVLRRHRPAVAGDELQGARHQCRRVRRARRLWRSHVRQAHFFPLGWRPLQGAADEEVMRWRFTKTCASWAGEVFSLPSHFQALERQANEHKPV